MYRAGIEGLIGLRKREPCVPRAWPGFTAVLRHGRSRYEIAVSNPHHVCCGVASMSVDGELLEAGVTAFPLVDDGASHRVFVTLGPRLD